MSLLMGVASRWKVISEGFGFDEDLIDEIDTNNETDEACLQDCVEKWVGRLQPTWKKLSIVLSNMGEDELAQDALNKGMYIASQHVFCMSCICICVCSTKLD